MESLKLSFNAIAPIFILMLTGYTLKKLKISDKKGFDTVNKLVFKLFLPVLLFYNLYKTDISAVFNAKLIIFTACGILINFAIGYMAAMLFTKDNKKRGVMLQGSFRSNFAILGIPLVGYICGENSGGVTALMLGVVIPFFNILAILSLEGFSGGENKVTFLQILKGIIKNPLIIACITGGVFLACGIKLPSIIEKSVKDISAVATPLAIIALGAEFEFDTIKESIKELSVTLVIKLIIAPLIMISSAIMLGISGEALACVLITFGSPVAVSSFAMAQLMGGDEQLAAHLVVLSSAVCLITLFLWIFVIGYFI